MSSTLIAMAAATANAAEVKKPKAVCTRTNEECMLVVFCSDSATLEEFPLEHSTSVAVSAEHVVAL
jgi:hypothetical protein